MVRKTRVFPCVFNNCCFNLLVLLCFFFFLSCSSPKFRLVLESTMWVSTLSSVGPQRGGSNVVSSVGLQCRLQCEVPLGAPLWGFSVRQQCGVIFWGCEVCFDEAPLWALLLGKRLLWVLLLNVDYPQCVSQCTTAQCPSASGPPSHSVSVPHPMPQRSTVQAASFGRVVGSCARLCQSQAVL